MYYLELAGEDDRFAIAEAGLACDNLKRLAPGIAAADTFRPELAERLALTHAVLRAITTAEGDLDDLVATMEKTSLAEAGSVSVRATAVRGEASIDATVIERRIGQVLVDRGYSVDLDDPDHVLRILATGDVPTTWYCGWIEVQPERGYGSRRPPKRPFRQPGTMRPQLARALVNLSGVRTDGVLLDPMCGAGAILMEAALVGARPVGMDLQRRMTEGAKRNVEAFVEDPTTVQFLQGSAASLPIKQADVAVFDAPYGRQSPIGFESAPALIERTLVELSGLVDRCVVVFDQPIETLAQAGDWTVTDRFTRGVHRSLTRHVVVLEQPD